MVRDAEPPRLIEMTFAPSSWTQRMHAATSASVPPPSSSSALHTISGEEKATPASPTPLSATAPIVPATWVPWPWPSAQVPSRIAPSTAAAHAATLPRRSSCVASMPVSTIPTLTPHDAVGLGPLDAAAAGQPRGDDGGIAVDADHAQPEPRDAPDGLALGVPARA